MSFEDAWKISNTHTHTLKYTHKRRGGREGGIGIDY